MDWHQAQEHAGLGYPVAHGESHRGLKRFIGKLCWPFLRHQVTVNAELIAELKSLSQQVQAVELQKNMIGSSLNDVATRLANVADELGRHFEVLVRHEEPLARHEALLVRTDIRFDETDKVISDLYEHLRQAVDRLEMLSERTESLEERTEIAQQQAFARHHDGIGAIRTELAELARSIAQSINRSEYQDDVASIRTASGSQFDHVRIDLQNHTERQERTNKELRVRISQLDAFFERFRHDLPEDSLIEDAAPVSSTFERLYESFLEASGETPSEARERLYPYLDEVRPSAKLGPILDLGCGRGEFLGLMKERGLDAYGIDINRRSIDECIRNGLDVRLEDARSHLGSIAKRSLGAITALGFIDHIDFDELVEILDLALLVLQPSGLIVLEARDALPQLYRSVGLASRHDRHGPLAPEFLSYLVSSRGFSDVSVHYRPHDVPARIALPDPESAPWAKDIAPLIERENERLADKETYAVVARRV